MERRIKFIHGLTICVIIVFALSQVYWLLSHYRLALQEREDELFAAIVAVAEQDVQARRTITPKSPEEKVRREYYTQKYMESMPDSTLKLNLTIVFGESDFRMNLDSFDSIRPDSAQTFHFELKTDSPIPDAQTDRAIELFKVNHNCPFAVEGLDSLLCQQNIVAQEIEVDSLQDSLQWEPALKRHTSLL